MRVGDLVRRANPYGDPLLAKKLGIVVDVRETGEACHVVWFEDGKVSLPFINNLQVVSTAKGGA